jgi:hypothetical protein
VGCASHPRGIALKLGIEISETSVAKYMVRHRQLPSQNLAHLPRQSPQNPGVRRLLLPVPTIRSQVLYVFLVLAHDRRRVVYFNVINNRRLCRRRDAISGSRISDVGL